MTNEQLIAYFEANLEKVKAQFGDDLHKKYVEHAEGQLEAVKRGGMEELEKFWAKWRADND